MTARVQASQLEAFDRYQQLGVVIEALRRLEGKVTDAKSSAPLVETRIKERGTKNAELCRVTEDLTQIAA